MDEILSSNESPFLEKIGDNTISSEIEMDVDDDKEKSYENNSSTSFYMKKVRRYKNKLTPYFAGIDISSDKVKKKLEERASRFGIEGIPTNNFSPDHIQKLYESIGISPSDKDVRLNAIHIRGVEEMSTEDIFQYFIKYGPESIEWIDDICCNIVWLEDIGAARALLGISKQLQLRNKNNCTLALDSKDKVEEEKDTTNLEEMSNEIVVILSDEESMDEDEDNEVSYKRTKSKNPYIEQSNDGKEKSEEFDIDEKGIWRLGLPYFKAKTLLMRFATTDDVKHPGAEKRSHYYTKYGNPNYNGLKGLISTSRKNKIKNKITHDDVNVELKELVSKTNRDIQIHSKSASPNEGPKKMYADIEESRIKAQHVKKPERLKGNVFSRLGKIKGNYDSGDLRNKLTRKNRLY